MRAFAPILLVALSCGCNLGEKVGDYVTESTLASVERKIEDKLAERGLESKELKMLFLADKEGRISPQSILDNAKDFTRDIIAFEANKLRSQLEERVLTEVEKRSGNTREELLALRKEMDKDKDGLVSRDEFTRELKSQTEAVGRGLKDDTQALTARLIDDIKSGTMTRADLGREIEQYKQDMKDRMAEFWKWLVGAIGTIVSLYLGKQAVSSKGKGITIARLDALEKITGFSLSGISPNGMPQAQPQQLPPVQPPTAQV